MKRLELSAEAELDMFEAALRYEGEREGLGFRFEVEVNRVFERIVRNPFQFGELDTGTRRALVHHFRYGVFFTVEAEVVMVFGILHLHRDPCVWQDRR